WPYYGLAPPPGIDPDVVNASPVVTYDTIPLGEVEVRRGDAVHATDGDIGHVQGLVIDPRSHHVSHVLLQEGHLWGRKEVSIPISSVTRVDDGIWLSISKQDVAGPPPAGIHPPAGEMRPAPPGAPGASGGGRGPPARTRPGAPAPHHGAFVLVPEDALELLVGVLAAGQPTEHAGHHHRHEAAPRHRPHQAHRDLLVGDGAQAAPRGV